MRGSYSIPEIVCRLLGKTFEKISELEEVKIEIDGKYLNNPRYTSNIAFVSHRGNDQRQMTDAKRKKSYEAEYEGKPRQCPAEEYPETVMMGSSVLDHIIAVTRKKKNSFLNVVGQAKVLGAPGGPRRVIASPINPHLSSPLDHISSPYLFSSLSHT